jgi:hypothetical protein
VFFFCANTAVDIATLTASAAAPVANMSRMAFLPGAMNQCMTISASVMDCTLVHYPRGNRTYRNVLAKYILVQSTG